MQPKLEPVLKKKYTEQLLAAEKALAAQELTIEQYEQRLLELDEKLMRSEQQIEKVADRYARTDYRLLDSIAGAIQYAIEQGDLEAAERMIDKKGSFQNRILQLHEKQREVAAVANDLKSDLYHKHTIALSRFMADTAAFYLRQRADLDSTDVLAQWEYAKFLNDYQREKELAFVYAKRAERQLLHTGDDRSLMMFRAQNEIGMYYNLSRQYDMAELYFKRSLSLCSELYGKDHKKVAGRLVNLGGVYYATGNFKEAKKLFNNALRIYHQPNQSDSITEAQTLSNLGAIAYAENHKSKAREYFEVAVQILRRCAPNHPTLPNIEYNLASICDLQGDPSSQKYFQAAYEDARRILGEDHPFTKRARNSIAIFKNTRDNID